VDVLLAPVYQILHGVVDPGVLADARASLRDDRVVLPAGLVAVLDVREGSDCFPIAGDDGPQGLALDAAGYVEVWGLHDVVPVATERVDPLFVGVDEQDVRSVRSVVAVGHLPRSGQRSQ